MIQNSNIDACPASSIISCKRPRCDQIETSSKRSCLSSQCDEGLFACAVQADTGPASFQPLPQIVFSKDSMFLQSENSNLHFNRLSEPFNYANTTASPATEHIYPTVASWNLPDVGRFPPPSTADLLFLLHTSLLPSVPSPSHAFPAPSPCAATSSLVPPAAHSGADLLAFLQGAAWAAGLREPFQAGTGRTDQHLPSLCAAAPPQPPQPQLPQPQLRNVFAALPAWQPAFRPIAAGR